MTGRNPRNPRKPAQPRYSGVHGGHFCIGDDSPADPAERTEREPAQPVNALEETLRRTPYGRQMLDLLGEAARLRLHEGVAVELVRSATDDLDRLRRALVTTREGPERERIAARIPMAEAELAKWRSAHADYERRREHLEYTLADGMRAFTR